MNHNVKFTQVEVTPTGLGKGILDSTAPMRALIEIKDFEVISKQSVVIPERIEHIVKCANPNCITNKEHDVPTKFVVLKGKDGHIKLHCHYCEKNTTEDKLEFI